MVYVFLELSANVAVKMSAAEYFLDGDVEEA